MLKRVFIALLITIVALSASLNPASAATKPGSTCKKVGQIVTESGKKYTCIKKGKNLVWDNGVKSASSDEGISVDKNLLNVDITIPASFYEGTKITQAELDVESAKKGFGKAKLNSDGSVSFRMSKSQYNKALVDMKKSIDDFIQETVNDSPKIYKEIKYNRDMTEFNVVVNRTEYESDFSAAMVGWGMALQGSFYQMFNGSKDPKLIVKIIDKASGAVFDTQKYPEK